MADPLFYFIITLSDLSSSRTLFLLKSQTLYSLSIIVLGNSSSTTALFLLRVYTNKINAAPIMMTPSVAPTPTPALAPLLSPPEDGVDAAGEAVVVAGLVDAGAAEADVAIVTVIGRGFEADEG